MLIINNISGKNMYQQIYEELRRQIMEGELSAGQRLPATRALARDYHIGRNTVIAAYTQLQAEGFIRSVIGSGYYVETLPEIIKPVVSPIPPFPEQKASIPSYDFRYGGIDLNVYRTRAFRRCFRNAFAVEEGKESLEYPGPQGLLPFRLALARYLHASRGVNTTPEQIVITGGHHYSMKMITELFPKDRYIFAMEEPGYRDTRDIFTYAGYTVYPIPLDGHGIQVDRLTDVFHALIYVTPSHQFPMGSILPVKRRMDLLTWAAATDSYIIEDDYDSELRYHERPIPSLQSLDNKNRVIYLGTFSKALSPDLRMSYAIFPQSINTDYERRYPFFNAPSPTLIQAALAEYIESGEYQKRLNFMRTAFRKKHDLIVNFIKSRFQQGMTLHGVGGGMHFIMEIDTPLSQGEIISEFAKDNVGVYPTKVFWHTPTLCPENQVIIGYGAIPLKKLPIYLEAMGGSLVRILRKSQTL